MVNTLPSIGIVTPSYNQARFLEETIRSVIFQGYPRLHYCVMDGGSDDGSVAIIDKYADQIDYRQSTRDGGQSDALASGFEKSNCEVLGWINSDDYLLPNALEKVGSYFSENPEVEAVSCGCLTVDENSRLLRNGFGFVTEGIAATADRFRFLEAQDGVFQPAVFWRRSAYDAVGGINRSLRFTMDLDLFTRLAMRRRFGRLSTFVSCFRIHSEAKSSRIQDVRTAELEFYRERYSTNRLPVFYRQLRYIQYRVPSLVRKFNMRLRNTLSGLPTPHSCGGLDAIQV